jgi:hypothetical protein
MLQPIKLQDRTGAHVAEASILPTLELPDVVVWGERVFIAHSRLVSPPVYRETFAAVAVSTLEGGGM